jgi:hypothetical protein
MVVEKFDELTHKVRLTNCILPLFICAHSAVRYTVSTAISLA